MVYIHIAAEGTTDGQLRRHEFVRAYRPTIIGGTERTAIAWTTASSVASVIEMVSTGELPQSGFIKQEDIPLDSFLDTKPGRRFAEYAA